MVACRAARPRRCADGTEVPSAAVLDATGHALKQVEFDQKFDPGYQAPPPPPLARTCLVPGRGARCSVRSAPAAAGTSWGHEARHPFAPVVWAVAVRQPRRQRRRGAQLTEHRRRGPQGAYGIMCDVESHPFELDTMLFMDWRDEHTEGYPEMREANR